jgi:hypothetical protein
MQRPLRMAATIRDLAQGGTRFKIVKHARQLREDFRRFATGDRPEVLLEGQRFEPLATKQGRKNEWAKTTWAGEPPSVRRVARTEPRG